MTALRPPAPYFGGKAILGPAIAGLFPPHRHYVEPYCGSLAVLLAKPPSAHETVNDLDQDLVAFWRVLRDRPDDLQRVCSLTPHARAEHQSAYQPAQDELERARRVWVQLTQGRAGVRQRTGWRHYQRGDASTTSMPGYLAGYIGRIAPAAARLAAVSLECLPALDLIRKYGRDDSTLLYIDPPYPAASRANADGVRAGTRRYVHEMLTDDEHRELAQALRSCAAAVVLSGYPSDLYDHELYPDWHRHEMHAGTGQGPNGWSNRTEVLWSNRPLNAQHALWEAG